MVGFKDIHPTAAFAFFAAEFAVSLTASHPMMLAACFVCACLCALNFEGKKFIKFFFKVIMPVMVLITALNSLFSHYGVTVLFVMKSGNNFTLESIIYGFVFAVRTACVLIWLESFNETMSSDKMIFLFGRHFPRTALTLSMVLRFVPLMRQRSKEMQAAQKGVGIGLSDENLFQRIRTSAHSVSILITHALESAVETADSMTSRGYGTGKRTPYSKFVFSRRDAALLLIAVGMTMLIILSGKSLYAVYTPVIEIERVNSVSVLCTMCFSVFSAQPLIIDLTEKRKWSHSR